MNVQILVDKKSWFVFFAKKAVLELKKNNIKAELIFNENKIKQGDILFILSWEKLIAKRTLKKNANNLVVHESCLPEGRGWSPLTWQILEGKNRIPITLFEAVEKADAGTVYFQDFMEFKGHELIEELREKQGKETIGMILKFVKIWPNASKKEQKGKSSYYPRRTPKDSELDINKTIKEQFNLLRVVDNERYPAFFNYLGKKYIIKISKANERKRI